VFYIGIKRCKSQSQCKHCKRNEEGAENGKQKKLADTAKTELECKHCKRSESDEADGAENGKQKKLADTAKIRLEYKHCKTQQPLKRSES
jgi:hypothetical protein